MIETLAAYLDAGGSFGRAAGALGVHENTVRYRIRQIEESARPGVGPGDLRLRIAVELVDVTGLAQARGAQRGSSEITGIRRGPANS